MAENRRYATFAQQVDSPSFRNFQGALAQLVEEHLPPAPWVAGTDAANTRAWEIAYEYAFQVWTQMMTP